MILIDKCRNFGTLKILLSLVFLLFLVTQVLEIYFEVNYNAVPAYMLNKLSSVGISTAELMKEDRTLIYTTNQSKFVPGFHRLNCGCNVHNDDGLPNLNYSSTCSAEATLHGTKQKVISYSLYADDSEARFFFMEGVGPSMEKIQKLFPGWVVRIYTNIPINSHSCAFICKYDFLFWCLITDIPKLGNLSEMNGRVWRYLAIGDPTVDVFLSRDLDSTPTQRERLAVSEWENSSMTVHVIRDSHWHETEILAGLWGFKNSNIPTKDLQHIQETIIRLGDRSTNKFWDQEIAERYIYYPYREYVMAHDTYFCGKYGDGITRPFLTKRVGQEFVGHDDRKEMNRMFVGKLKVCPVECRPENGKDWKYC